MYGTIGTYGNFQSWTELLKQLKFDEAKKSLGSNTEVVENFLKGRGLRLLYLRAGV